MRLIPILALLALTATIPACGRPLTDSELRLADEVFGADLDTTRVRFHADAPIGHVTRTYPVRPRTTCQELILPPPEGPTIQGRTAGITLFNHIHTRDAWSSDNYAADYPDRLNLVGAMFFVHELVHVWQWQNRDLTGFTPWRAAWEHTQLPDPYLFDDATEARFLDYGYEQQGALVEEYVCCAVLDPDGARTERLRALVSQNLPISDISAVIGRTDIWLPWDGVTIDGICNQNAHD